MTIWPKSSQERVSRALGAHAVIGVVMGALLYIVSLSGALIVFENEIAWWEQPTAPQVATLSPEGIDAAARAIAAADAEPTSHIVVYLPTPELPRAIAATDNLTLNVDEAGAPAQANSAPWAAFVLGLHYYLHLPSTYGFIFVGLLGAVMLALIVSGFLAHPGVFRTAFAMRRNGSARTAETDLHNRLAVWTAPFQLTIAFTGAWIGLFSLAGALMAQLGYDGDQGVVVDTVFGWSMPADETPAPLPDVAAAVRHLAETNPNLTPTTLIVHEPATGGQHMQILAEHPQRLILGEYYNYDAAGVFQGTVGLADGTVGQQFAMSLYPVHFGRYGGLWLRALYSVLGLALCVIIASGVNLYLIKRSQQGRDAPRLSAAWEAIVWGAPASLGLTLLASVSGTIDEPRLGIAFWITLALMVVFAAAWPR
ncbi:MAG TPA: PepSY-associated TM helix domain-containing protein, partial [Verrucomicrobiae bacterium]|nr:PepSY-associated TM helix domain-containing protein [Verrucomicrobiae bacterium]